MKQELISMSIVIIKNSFQGFLKMRYFYNDKIHRYMPGEQVPVQ